MALASCTDVVNSSATRRTLGILCLFCPAVSGEEIQKLLPLMWKTSAGQLEVGETSTAVDCGAATERGHAPHHQ